MQKYVADNNCACPLYTKLGRFVVRAISIQGGGWAIGGRLRAYRRVRGACAARRAL